MAVAVIKVKSLAKIQLQPNNDEEQDRTGSNFPEFQQRFRLSVTVIYRF